MTRLTLDGDPAPRNPTLWVLNSASPFGSPIQLDFGWTPFQRHGAAGAPRPDPLRPGAGRHAAAGRCATTYGPADRAAGLAVALNGATLQQRVDPFIGSAAWQPGPNAYVPGKLTPTAASILLENVPLAPLGGAGNVIRWQGEVYADQSGTYLMEASTGGRVQMMVNNILIVNLCDPPPGNTQGVGTVRLEAGWNPLQSHLPIAGRRHHAALDPAQRGARDHPALPPAAPRRPDRRATLAPRAEPITCASAP